MSYPLSELSAALTSRASTLGRVVGRKGDQVICATPNGKRQAVAAQTLGIGDRVVIRDGLAYRSPAVGVRVAV